MKPDEYAAMPDGEFVALVEEGAIAPERFGHVAHVRTAFLILRGSASFAVAIDRMSRTLRRIAELAGVPDKYHETVTVAFMAVVHERMASAADDESWPVFAARNDDLIRTNPLAAYYSREQLSDPLARRVFVLPARQRSAA